MIQSRRSRSPHVPAQPRTLYANLPKRFVFKARPEYTAGSSSGQSSEIQFGRDLTGRSSSLPSILSPTSGMKFPMLLNQARLFHGRVDLRGGNVGMSQHFLDHTQICAPTKQMSGKGMAQHMGLDRLFNARTFGHYFGHGPQGFA